MHRVEFLIACKNQVNNLICSNFPNNQQRSLPYHIYMFLLLLLLHVMKVTSIMMENLRS